MTDAPAALAEGAPAAQAPAIIHLPYMPADDLLPAKKARHGSDRRQRRHVRNIRFDDGELAELEARAGDAGLSVGAYLRKCALGEAGPRARRRLPVIDVELLARNNAALNRIGNNLNQIARALHRDDPERQRVEELRGALLTTLAANRQALGHDREG